MDTFKFTVIIISTLFLLVVFSKPIINISRFFLRSVLYSLLIFIINFVTGSFGVTVGINLATSFVCGFLGIYGFIFTYFLRFMYPWQILIILVYYLWIGGINMIKKPLKLSPAFKDYLWGGTKLKTLYNKKSDLEKVAESWELSTHKDGESVIRDGEYMGMSLSSFVAQDKENILGKNASKFEFFPILIKFIDALDSLSIQVHPSDEYALTHEKEYGKTEMWYILDCEEGAFLYYGFNREITKEEFRKRLEDNTILDVLNKVYVKKGDVFFINAGTVHAIGKGIMICEIQQNSNTTYRVYDYNRKDKFGNLRDLHIDKAIDVSYLSPCEPYKQEGNVLASCDYFTVLKYEVDGENEFYVSDDCFRSVIVTEGAGELILNDYSLSFEKGDSIFIPAQNGKVNIKGNCEIIVSYV